MNAMRNTALCLLLVLGSACAPSTPQTRIDRNPELYQALTAAEQERVAQGELRKGMSKEAAFLAWGAPNRKSTGEKDGTPRERWDYLDRAPVYQSNLYGGYRSGYYGPYGRYSGIGFAAGPEITYVPYRKATIWFIRDKVDSWEQVQ